MTEEKSDRKKKNTTGEYIASIIVNIVLLYVANNLLAWNTPHLAEGFTASLWILNISLVVTIIFNLIFLVVNPKWLVSLGQAITSVISAIALYTFYVTFPLDFTGGNEQLAKVIIIFALIATLIGALVQTILFILRLAKSE